MTRSSRVAARRRRPSANPRCGRRQPLFVEEMLALFASAATATSTSHHRSRRCSPPGSTNSTRRSGTCSSAARSRGRSSTAARCRHSGQKSPRIERGSSPSSARSSSGPTGSQLPGDDAYRFRHLLIRDAAYEALPKSTRAELHERFADWWRRTAWVSSSSTRSSATTSSRHTATASSSAVRRTRRPPRHACRRASRPRRRSERESAAMCRHVVRSSSGLSPFPRPAFRRPAYAWSWRRRSRTVSAIAWALAEEARAEAVAVGSRGLELLALMQLTLTAMWVGAEGTAQQLEAYAQEAIQEFDSPRDERGLMYAWQRGGSRRVSPLPVRRLCRGDGARTRSCTARGREKPRAIVPRRVGTSRCIRSDPGRGGARVVQPARLARVRTPRHQSLPRRVLGLLGRFDEAGRRSTRRKRKLVSWGWRVRQRDRVRAGQSALVESDFAEAERQLALGLQYAKREGSLAVASTYEAQHARALLGLGRDDEAETAARASRDVGASDDIATQMLWRQALARVLARRGEQGEAQKLAREAVAQAETTDMLWVRGDAGPTSPRCSSSAATPTARKRALERALAEYEQKGVIPAIERTRARLASLRAPA